jgi:hypothetical protein
LKGELNVEHIKKRMNIKLGASKGLEKILLEWFQQICSENVPISRPILCQNATDIALCIKADSFKASNGWLHRHLKLTVEFIFLLKVYLTPI